MDEIKMPTIDISQLIFAVVRRWVIIVLIGILSGIVCFAYSNYFITPVYRATSTMLVDLRNSMHENLTYEKINLSEKYATTIAYIMKTNTVLQPVIDELNLKETSASLASKITVTAIEDSMLLKVSVDHHDKNMALKIIKVLDKCAPEVINEKLTSGYIIEIESPMVSSTPISPNVSKNTAMGALVGMLLAAFVIVVITLFNNRIKSISDLQAVVDVPVLGVIPHTVRQQTEQKSKGE